ncbi:MAG: DNA polymerase III subunit gamma/tau [Bacilli bacterium]|nr:DNA polymerase III subunit gamma/tau [Bacilli bacterium]MDY4052673.1 DNA polymerase III subunit gamma/tau [Bacilli bacterium]
MAYKALYRTYRPTRFEDVVGQKHIIKILKNACVTNRISHAYVFSGLRGIGKTTIARIFAKAVNCELSKDGEPCNVCRNCLSIINDETTDVIELDAASNNGVDQMRDILEKVNFLPSSLKKKVYIIDEAHMLSTAAFNALLKTLEEPPAHVIFILATTEPYKLPSTILSRCQRLDFKQLSTHEIVEMLSKVVTKENIGITDEALLGIAEASEGSMRDALSILDQARVYESNQITLQDVNSLTGRISQEYLTSLVKAINEKNIQLAIDNIGQLIENGKEVSRILTCLIQFCRDLLLYKSVRDESDIIYMYKKEDFEELADELSDKKLFYYVDSFVEIQNKIRYTNSQKIYLEVGIIKLINNANTDIDLLTQIKKLEEKINLIDPQDDMDSVTSILNRLDEVENKVKKSTIEFEKANIQGFKDSIISKISLLEDMTLANKNLPVKLEEKIQDIEEKLVEINTTALVGTTAPTSDEDNKETINEDIITKINEIENKLQQINQNNEGLAIEEIKKQLETVQLKLDTSSINNTNDVLLKIRELEERLANIAGNEEIMSLKQKISNLEQEISNLPITKATPTIETPVQSSNKDITERLEIVEEYLDMVITKVDELSRGMKQTNGVDNSDIREEINQLNDNYMTLLNHIQSLQEHTSTLATLETNNESSDNQRNIDYINTEKEEINKLLESMYNELKELIEANYNDLNSKVLNVDENISVKVNSLHQIIDSEISAVNTDLEGKINAIVIPEIPEVVDYSSQIDVNKQSINDLKEYTLKLSAKLQEVQNKVVEINTKLDGGITKRRSPFEITREEEVEEKETKVPEENIQIPNSTTIYEEPTKVVKSNDNTVVVKTKPHIENNPNDPNNVYDIKIVERILNQAHAQACREEKVRLLSIWPRLEDKVGHLLAPTAKLLSEGLLTANGEKELLIVFPHASMCNHLMEPKGHTNALQIIKIAFGKDYDFIALPENTWQEKRKEYAGQFHIGIKYPRLTPINNPELKINTINTNNLFSKKNASVHQAQNLFGTDLVEREEE